MFFLTDSNFFYIIASTKRDFVLRTFGLGLNTQRHTVMSNFQYEKDWQNYPHVILRLDFTTCPDKVLTLGTNYLLDVDVQMLAAKS